MLLLQNYFSILKRMLCVACLVAIPLGSSTLFAATTLIKYEAPTTIGATILDTSGNSHHSEIVDTVVSSTDVPTGMTGHSFDTTSGSFRTTETQLLNQAAIQAAGGFSYDYWFKWDGTGAQNLGKILDYAGTDYGTVNVGTGAFNAQHSGLPGINTSSPVSINQWHHVQTVFNSGSNTLNPNNSLQGELILVLDGVFIGKTSGNKSAQGDGLNRPFSFGRHPTSVNELFQGLIYNPTVYLGAIDLTIPTVTINRDTGELSLSVANVPAPFLPVGTGYTISSQRGSLDPTEWSKLSPTGWVQLSNDPTDATDLSEATFDSSQTHAFGNTSFGNVWNKSPFENNDITFEYLDTDGNINAIPVFFTGNGGSAYDIGDFDYDGDIDAADWVIIRDFNEGDLSAFSGQIELYNHGDLNGDGSSDTADLRNFKGRYNAVNGAGSFTAMLERIAVPEPSSVILLLMGSLFMFATRSKKIRNVKILAALALLVTLFSGTNVAQATVVKPSLVTGTIPGNAGSNVNFLLDDNPALGAASLQAPVGTEAFLNTGDSLAKAVNTFALYAGPGHQESWTSQITNGNPVFSFDLGANTDIGSVLLWNYGNTGGGAHQNGNATRDFELIFHTELEGDSFSFDTETGGTEAVEYNGTMDRAINGGNPATLPTTADNKMQFFGFDALKSVRYVGLRIATNYGGEPGLIAGGDRYGLGEVRFATELLGPEDPNFGIIIDRSTGEITLKNNNLRTSQDLEYYEISSDADELNKSSWASLDDQNHDQGANTVGWDELGNTGNGRLAEFHLESSSTFVAEQSVSLGNTYTGNSEDLTFSYQIEGLAEMFTGTIEYTGAGGGTIPGDTDGDGDVDATDLAAVGLNWDPSGANAPHPLLHGNFDGDTDVDASDLAAVGLNWNPAGGGSSLSTAAVPEPSSLILLAIGFVCLGFRKKM